MGAWGHGSFENDDAADFGIELESRGWEIVYSALHAATGLAPEEYLEAPEASQALAAAEVVAAVKTGEASRLPPDVRAAVAGLGPLPDMALIDGARAAIVRVLADSELKDLWAESGDDSAWLEDVATLAERLR